MMRVNNRGQLRMTKLQDFESHIKIKLSAIWGSVMSLYIYCDYFQLYTPGKLQAMLAGTTIFGKGDQLILLGLSTFMLVTSLMICASILMPAKLNKWLNIFVGVVMTVFLAILAFKAGYYYYKVYAVVESLLTFYIVWLAWQWPKQTENEVTP